MTKPRTGNGLVLTRAPEETIEVDGPCTITLVRTVGRKAKLQIAAEPGVGIRRGELERHDEDPPPRAA